MEIKAQVRQYILDNFLYSDDEGDLTDDMSLFDNGVVDSTGVLELVGFIEDTFEVAVDDTDLVPDNFDSVDRIVAFIQSKLG